MLEEIDLTSIHTVKESKSIKKERQPLAKKKDKDGVPIRFDTSKSSRSHVPIPINQPNWVYKSDSKTAPTFISILVAIIVTFALALGFIAAIAMLLDNSLAWKDKLLLSAGVAFALIVIGLHVIKSLNNKNANTQQEQREKKKLMPKKRKDSK